MNERDLLQMMIDLVHAMDEFEHYGVPRFRDEYDAVHLALYKYYKMARDAAAEDTDD